MSMETALVLAAALVAIGLIVTALGRRGQSTPTFSELEPIYRIVSTAQIQLDEVHRAQQDVIKEIGTFIHRPGQRGVWGEYTLRNHLEQAGMKQGVDFTEQAVLDKGRPDIIIHLGEAGEIVVDSKAPLDHLFAARDAEVEEERVSSLKAYADTLRRYAIDLSKRDYASKLDTTFAPVVMYVPTEGAWQAAQEVRPNLFAELLQLRVYPADPSTMGMIITLLKQYGRIANQGAAVRTIVEGARKLLDGMRIHMNHLAGVAKGLDQAAKAYNSAVGNLEANTLPAGRAMAEHIDSPIVEIAMTSVAPDEGRLQRLIDREEAA